MWRRHILQERRANPDGAEPTDGEATFVEIDLGRLSRVFAVPEWLRDLGLMSWLLVGTFLLLGSAVWLLSLTATIVVPVITASIIAAVLSPVVG